MTDLSAIISGYFKTGTTPANLYMGLVSANNYSALNPLTDSMASHPGWEEWTDISQSARPLWDPGSVIDGYPSSVNNPAPALVTPTVAGQVIGIFLCDDDTLGGTSGQLYGPWFFNQGPRTMVAGSSFKLQVKISLKNNTPVN